MKPTYILLFAMLFSGVFAQAQDKLSLRSGETLEVKIIEFGTAEIKYKTWPQTADAPIFTVEKTKVKKLELQTGEVFEYNADAFADSLHYAQQKQRAIKFNFLSPLNSTLLLGYEKSIKPGQSYEFGLGWIGAGFDPAGIRPRGVTASVGWKFMRSPDFYTSGMRYAHILKGGYIKPTIIFSHYARDLTLFNFSNQINDVSRVNNTGVAVLLTFGKQWVFDDAFLVDLFWGIGYGASDNDYVQYGFFGGDGSFPVALNAGLRIGMLLK
jgi:hypothetical protein